MASFFKANSRSRELTPRPAVSMAARSSSMRARSLLLQPLFSSYSRRASCCSSSCSFLSCSAICACMAARCASTSSRARWIDCRARASLASVALSTDRATSKTSKLRLEGQAAGGAGGAGGADDAGGSGAGAGSSVGGGTAAGVRACSRSRLSRCCRGCDCCFVCCGCCGCCGLVGSYQSRSEPILTTAGMVAPALPANAAWFGPP
mmetsp:Transcript_60591/g.136901  ORF Transcript_60591/g.136901 Transcript_60591/m.136901 type:complete len:206 (+) Transcript_60591:386-1003(+)